MNPVCLLDIPIWLAEGPKRLSSHGFLSAPKLAPFQFFPVSVSGATVHPSDRPQT